MARRNDSVSDALVTLSWRMNVAVALSIFLSLRYVLPVMSVTDPFLKGITESLTDMAPVLALILLLVAGVSALSAWRKGKLLEDQKDIDSIRFLSWPHFEELVGEAYRGRGFHVTETRGDGADGVVDLVLEKGAETLLVHCKNWRTSKAGVKAVRELHKAVAARGATGGVVMISWSFNQEAQDFARGKPLELIDGGQLVEMVDEIRRTPPILSVSDPNEEKNCPLCGGELVLRVARKGPRAGEKFWGCSGFPKCRGVKACID